MDRGAWWAIDHGVTELDTTEHARAHTHTHTHTHTALQSSPGPVSELVVSSGWPSSKPPPGLHWASLSPGRTMGSHCCTFIGRPLLLGGSRPPPRAGLHASGRLLCGSVPEGTILAAALLFLLAKRVGVQQAFAGERRQKIKLLKLHSCRQIERPPNSSELPNLDPSAHLPPQEVVG